jgi:hypothetical protein
MSYILPGWSEFGSNAGDPEHSYPTSIYQVTPGCLSLLVLSDKKCPIGWKEETHTP